MSKKNTSNNIIIYLKNMSPELLTNNKVYYLFDYENKKLIDVFLHDNSFFTFNIVLKAINNEKKSKYSIILNFTHNYIFFPWNIDKLFRILPQLKIIILNYPKNTWCNIELSVKINNDKKYKLLTIFFYNNFLTKIY